MDGKLERAEQSSRYRERYPEKVAQTKRKCRFQSRHGITEEDYEAMESAQGGRCAVCGTTRPGGRSKDRFCIDHDHVSGEIRGLLCFGCNTVLGRLGDNADSVEAWTKAAIAYLRKA